LVNGFGEARSEAEGLRLDAGPRAGVGFLGWGSQPHPHQLEALGSALSSPSGVRGRAPAAKGFSRILNIQDDLSGQQDYGPIAKRI